MNLSETCSGRTAKPLPPSLAGRVADARAVLFKALARGLKPPPVRTVTRWADERRYVAAEASPWPGKWSTETTPYLAEPMACLSPSDPCRSVTAKKSHQLGFTEGGLTGSGPRLRTTRRRC